MDSEESKRSGSSDQREQVFPATPMVKGKVEIQKGSQRVSGSSEDPGTVSAPITPPEEEESDISLWDNISDYVQGQISYVRRSLYDLER